MKKLITKEQIRCIKTVQHKYQGNDEYYEMLKNRFKVTSCTQLTCDQGNALIKLFVKWGWMGSKPQKPGGKSCKGESVPRQSGNMTKMVSPAQKKKIGALANMVKWRVKDGLTRWTARRFSIEKVKTAQQAWMVIEGLKKMFERQMEKQHGPEWKNLDYDDISIRRYVEEYR